MHIKLKSPFLDPPWTHSPALDLKKYWSYVDSNRDILPKINRSYRQDFPPFEHSHYLNLYRPFPSVRFSVLSPPPISSLSRLPQTGLLPFPPHPLPQI